MARPSYKEDPGHAFRYICLNLPQDVIRSVARIRLRAHTLRVETVTWTHDTSPTCDLCNACDVHDVQHVLYHCTHPYVVSLRRTFASLFPPTGFHRDSVSAFLSQNNIKLYFFLHPRCFL